VRPLLPGAPGCLVLVTSRNQLTSLVAAHSAHPLTLDLLTRHEAWELLGHRLGPDRIAAEPDAVDEIITTCARLPLALALVAAHAALRPHTPLHTLAEQLRDTQHRWDTLTGDDPATDVQAVFSWSYRSLSPAAARLFRLLGLHPGPDISAPAAASLAALPSPQVRSLLAELVRANLLTEPTPGRYTLHDLLRADAAARASDEDRPSQRHAAQTRFLDHYLYTADAASLLLYPYRNRIAVGPPHPGAMPEDVTDAGQAMAWFTTEYLVLVAAVRQAADIGFHAHACQLAGTLEEFCQRRGHWHNWQTIAATTMEIAQRLGHRPAQAHAHRWLANAYALLGRYNDAETHYQQALDLFDDLGDRVGQAHTLSGLYWVPERRGDLRQALNYVEQAHDLYQAAGHQAGQGRALNAVGWLHALLGHYQQALTCCQKALDLLQKLDDHHGQAHAWDATGDAYRGLGHLKRASHSYQQAIALYRKNGDRLGEAMTLTHLGDTHHDGGNPPAAHHAYQEALTILDDLDHPDADTVRTKLNALDTPPRSTS
jgi:tetratricopeptide (TPR) repeat protein